MELTPDLLMELPAELCLKLREVVELVDFDTILEIVEKIREQHEIMAHELTDLVN